MAHVFDIMGSLSGQLNVLTGHYCNRDLLNSIESVPTFIAVTLDRNKRFTTLTDGDDIEIDSIVISNTHDIFNPLYIVTASNIKSPIVLKAATIVTKNDKTGPAVAYIVVIPKFIFNESTDIKDIIGVLKKMYFDLLNTDTNMSFKASDKMLEIGNNNNNELFVPTYDLTMLYVVYGFIHIYIKNYFEASSLEIVNIILGEDYDRDSRINLSDTLERNCGKLSSLREAFGFGTLLSDALYE